MTVILIKVYDDESGDYTAVIKEGRRGLCVSCWWRDVCRDHDLSYKLDFRYQEITHVPFFTGTFPACVRDVRQLLFHSNENLSRAVDETRTPVSLVERLSRSLPDISRPSAPGY